MALRQQLSSALVSIASGLAVFLVEAAEVAVEAAEVVEVVGAVETAGAVEIVGAVEVVLAEVAG